MLSTVRLDRPTEAIHSKYRLYNKSNILDILDIYIITSHIEPLAVNVSPYDWLMTHYGWLAG